MSLRACLRFVLLAAMLLAPLGRIGMAQAMTVSGGPTAAMAHCAGMPAAPTHQNAHQQKAPDRDAEKMAVDCMIACAAMAPAPDSFVAPRPTAVTLPAMPLLASLSGIRPEADPPPPRFS